MKKKRKKERNVMKKRICLWTAFILLICLCACNNLNENTDITADTDINLKADSDTPIDVLLTMEELSASDFSDTTRNRDENYAAVLKTKTVTLDDLTVHIAENIFDEKSSPALAEKIAADYAALRALDSEFARPTDVYVLRLTATGAPVVAGGELFCTLEQVESGDYSPYLVKTVFDCPSWWQCVGLSRMVFGSETVENFAAKLTDNPGQDIYLLTLFPAYFLEDFAEEETRALAAQTAQSLTEYILFENDLSTFLAEGNDVAYREAWLESIGVPAELDYLRSDAAVHVAQLPFSETKDVPLILTDEQFTMNLRSTDWLTTADDVYYFMLDFYKSLGQLYSFLETNAPVYYASLQAGEIKCFSINIYDSSYGCGSSANADRGEVIVLDWHDALHETVHCLIPESTVENYDDWLSEGLTTWLSAPYISVDAGRSFIDKFVKNMDLSQLSEDTREMVEMIWSVFQQLTGRDIFEIYEMESPADKPMYWFYQSLVRAVLLLPDSEVSIPFATLSVADRFGSPNTYPGNQLSYGEAMLFVEYLAEEYDLDTVIAALIDGTAYRELFLDETAFKEEYDRFIEHLTIKTPF